jgi:hypothetical protein
VASREVMNSMKARIMPHPLISPSPELRRWEAPGSI